MNQFKEEISILISKELNIKKEEILTLIESPPDPNLGDLSLPCFQLAKFIKKNPNQIAQELKSKIKNPIIKEIKVVGPYLNFFFNNEKLIGIILKKILKEKEKYGFKPNNNKKVVIEFPSPNTNKPLHLGHLRNMSLGESVSRLLESQGYKVFRVNLNNDRGIHICKSMIAYKKWGKNKQPDKKPDHFVGDFYVMFSQNESPELEKEAQEMLRKWEAGDKETLNLWKKMNNWALEGFNTSYKRVGLKFDKTYFESKIYKKGKKLILDCFKKDLFQKDKKGAIFIDLKELGKKILLREDGTAIYITQDIYLCKLKFDDFKFENSIIVSAHEQDYHFKVLFKILELLKFPFANKFHHLSYGMVNLPEGRMKSREGTVVDADDLIQELVDMAKIEIETRQNITQTEMNKIAEKIGLAAIKCYLLKSSAHKDIIFNPKESISFEGETGPYLQYSLVRANKILQKTKSPKNLNLKYLKEKEEVNLIKKMNDFPEIIKRSAETYSPHYLTEYSFKLASLFNLFYEKHQVINAKNDQIKNARLALVLTYTYLLNSCLNLLGIEKVQIM